MNSAGEKTMTTEISLTLAAQENVRETGADVDADVSAIRSGDTTREALLAYCLDGADPDRLQGWYGYGVEVES
jgi:hypothetical protein